MNLSLIPTLALMIAGGGLSVFCGWMGARPWDIRKGPRMTPWRLLMLVSFTLSLLMALHLLNLLGIETGRNQPGYPPLGH